MNVRRLLLFLAACALVVPAVAGTSARPQMKLVRAQNLLGPTRPIHDAVIRGPVRTLADDGTLVTYFTQPGNVPVQVAVSPDYTTGIAPQELVNFLGSLVHGSELPRLKVYVVRPESIAERCGTGAVACYFSSTESILIAGDDSGGPPLEQVIAHEYGHHIAENRSNAPWPAIAYGPKRWASYMDVCRASRHHLMFPGAEQPPEYELNPGEGWAESYRFYSAQRAGTWPPFGGLIVDELFRPDATALARVAQDVLEPWDGQARIVKKGVLRSESTRRFLVHTPYDGIVHASVAGRGVRLRLANVKGRPLTAWRASASYTVCGSRNLLAVAHASRRATFRLTISRP